MAEAALVRNAADSDQVRRARRLSGKRAERFANALRASLATAEGRLVVAEVLERAGLYRSVFDREHAVMAFNEGRRNFGLELRVECERASTALTDLMDVERRKQRDADNREVDAGHTPSAEEHTV